MISDEQCAMQVNAARARGAMAVFYAVADFIADEQRKGTLTQAMLVLAGEARKAADAIHAESMVNIRQLLELENVAS